MNIEELIIVCKTCIFFYGDEGNVLNKWKNENDTGEIVSHGSFIKMCHHSSCFEYRIKNDPERGPVRVRKRIKGQGQLNKNNDCKYYKKRKSFWEKIREKFGKKKCLKK